MSRSRGASSFTRSPPMISSPSLISSRPATIRSAVDFPQPDGPTRIMNSPSLISRFMSLTASKPSGYRFQIPLKWISAIGCSWCGGLSGRFEFDAGEPAEDAPGLQLPAEVHDLVVRAAEPQPGVEAGADA